MSKAALSTKSSCGIVLLALLMICASSIVMHRYEVRSRYPSETAIYNAQTLTNSNTPQFKKKDDLVTFNSCTCTYIHTYVRTYVHTRCVVTQERNLTARHMPTGKAKEDDNAVVVQVALIVYIF